MYVNPAVLNMSAKLKEYYVMFQALKGVILTMRESVSIVKKNLEIHVMKIPNQKNASPKTNVLIILMQKDVKKNHCRHRCL
jgi:hypothetical protein